MEKAVQEGRLPEFHEFDIFELFERLARWYHIDYNTAMRLPLNIFKHYCSWAEYNEQMEWYKLSMRLASGM